MQIKRRHKEMLLEIRCRQMLYGAHIAVVFERGRNPRQKVVAYLARGRERHALMRPWPAEGFLESEIGDQQQSADTLLHDRTQFE